MSEVLVGNYRLRPMEPRDLERVLEWRNHPEIRRYMFTQHEISSEEHAEWFARSSVDKRKRLLMFEFDGEPLGFSNLSCRVSPGIWDWGFYVAPAAPRGTGRKLGLEVLEIAFAVMRVHKLCGQVLGGNDRSIRFHRALGFTEEGTLRQQHFDGAQYRDVICFGFLHSEWHPEGQ